MNKIINWVFGSFFRTLGRIFVYILLGLVLSYLLKDVKIPKINVSNLILTNVSALENIDIYAGYNLSDSGMFWNVSSSGTTQKGYDLYTTNSQNAWYYASPTSNISLTYLGGGMAITQCGYGFLDNNYYSVSYVFNSGYSPYLHPYYTSKNPSVIGISEASTTYRSDISYTDVSNSIEQVYYADGFYVDTFSLIFKANRNGSCITTTFSSSTNVSYNDYFFFRGIKLTSLGQKAPTTEEITNALSSNFTNVINNNNNNTSTIINNNNSNTNSIINNQNANSQAEIQNANENTDRTIESQNVCSKEIIDKNDIYTDNYYLHPTNGGLISFNIYGITDYIHANELIVKQTIGYDVGMCFYDKDKTLISCTNEKNLTYNSTINFPSNYYYFRATINKNNNSPIFEGKICKNGNQAMNDYITDDTAPSSDISSLGTVQGLLPPGPVDSLLNIPVAFLSVITSSMSGTCTPLQGDFVYGSTLSIPCFGEMIYDNNSFPPVLMLFINVIPSAFILIEYFKHLYKKVDRAVSMDATADDDWGVI